ncbi:MAG: hypothetical protein GY865_02595 [candidate division Zixibacteria bacterium]|nr:hypothetical protein [candidate division Zixibacteria bacterium]
MLNLYFGYACYKLAKKKNRDYVAWAFGGLTIGFIALIILHSNEKLEEPNTTESIRINRLAISGIILGCTFLLYSVVNIILSFLDKTQQNIGDDMIFLIYGLIIVTTCTAFMKRQKWGWIGYTAILGLIVILTALGTIDIYGIILGLLSLLALVWILTPSVRKLYFSS